MHKTSNASIVLTRISHFGTGSQARQRQGHLTNSLRRVNLWLNSLKRNNY